MTHAHKSTHFRAYGHGCNRRLQLQIHATSERTLAPSFPTKSAIASLRGRQCCSVSSRILCARPESPMVLCLPPGIGRRLASPSCGQARAVGECAVRGAVLLPHPHTDPRMQRCYTLASWTEHLIMPFIHAGNLLGDMIAYPSQQPGPSRSLCESLACRR
jgi:hypothetical protein